MVPGEVCMGSAERRNRRDKKKPALSMQKSAEAIVPRKLGKGGTKAAGVTGERRTVWGKQKTPGTVTARGQIARNAKETRESRVRRNRKAEKRKSESRDCWKQYWTGRI